MSVQSIGVILMVVGVTGLVLSFILWSSWGESRRRVTVDCDETVVDDDRCRRHGYGDHDDIDRAA